MCPSSCPTLERYPLSGRIHYLPMRLPPLLEYFRILKLRYQLVRAKIESTPIIPEGDLRDGEFTTNFERTLAAQHLTSIDSAIRSHNSGGFFGLPPAYHNRCKTHSCAVTSRCICSSIIFFRAHLPFCKEDRLPFPTPQM